MAKKKKHKKTKPWRLKQPKTEKTQNTYTNKQTNIGRCNRMINQIQTDIQTYIYIYTYMFVCLNMYMYMYICMSVCINKNDGVLPFCY